MIWDDMSSNYVNVILDVMKYKNLDAWRHKYFDVLRWNDLLYM